MGIKSISIGDRSDIKKVTLNGGVLFEKNTGYNYLCFTAEETNSTISMSNTDGYAPEISLETSNDGINWTPFVVDDTTIILENIGDKVYFRGDNESMVGYNEEDENYYGNIFIMTGKIAASGNIMSLLDKTCKSMTIVSKYGLAMLFYDCTSLITAPELPATILADECYDSMFHGCTSLTTAPELPATTLANDCYVYMFQDCTSLTKAPELPATTLAFECYAYMFAGCTSLTTAPELPATTLTDYCYSSMFNSCTSLTAAPILPATMLANDCYDCMFYDCTALTTAPELPAITLTDYCYYRMFYGCTSLTTPPELPATTLANWCYTAMFLGCTSLYVSDTSGEGYDKAWNIPTVGVASGDYDMYDMFGYCPGTRSPDIENFDGKQKTYYTQNVPV